MTNPTENKTRVDINDTASGIVASNNFLGLLPLPYSFSVLQNSLLPPLTSSYVETNNNSSTSYTFPKPSTSFNDSNNIRKQSNQMSGPSYRRASFAIPKPPSFNQSREKERSDLSTLNDKFADYVEKVRYLESQNKKIQMDTNFLTEKEQENSQKITTLFEKEIAQLKETAEKLFKNKNALFANSQETQNSIPPLKQRLTQTFKESDSSKYETEKIERQLSSIDGDILMYKRRLAYQDNEHTQWKQFLNHVQRLLLQAKNEIHNENLTRASCEQTIRQIHVDINRLREQQQQKLKDLKYSSFILSPNSTNDRAHSFKSELSNAIRRIRLDFEKQNDLYRDQLYRQFTQSYDDISRQYPELAHLFSNEREQERIKQEEERLRIEIQRVRTDSQLLKQKNSELKLHVRELEINLEMDDEENKRIQQIQQNEINQFKLKHEKITKEYEDVITKQISLEKEIETYRNLLEGTMKPVVDHITEEYNTMAANQINTEHRRASINRKSRSASVDRVLSPHFDTNTYVSYMSLNNKSQSTDSSSTLVIDVQPPTTTTTNGNNLKTTKSSEELNVKNNGNELHIVEKDEIRNTSSPLNGPRQIIIQTRRNN